MPTLLVIDDSDTVRREIRTAMEKAALFDRILEAADGIRGLKLLMSEPLDVVLCDLRMPGTDGLAFMDGFLYTLDGTADTIFKVDHATGDVVSSCTTGMFAVGGLAAEDGRLFAVLGLTAVV